MSAIHRVHNYLVPHTVQSRVIPPWQRIQRIALPIIIFGLGQLQTVNAGPGMYGTCVAVCGALTWFQAPACLVECLPLWVTPGP